MLDICVTISQSADAKHFPELGRINYRRKQDKKQWLRACRRRYSKFRCWKISKKKLGSQGFARVGRVTGNKEFFLLGLMYFRGLYFVLPFGTNVDTKCGHKCGHKLPWVPIRGLCPHLCPQFQMWTQMWTRSASVPIRESCPHCVHI